MCIRDRIQEENLDVRTVTMGISLLDCCDSDMARACERVYDKITRRAEHLVAVAEQIEKEYGIPIINKRISVTPIAMILAACEHKMCIRDRPSGHGKRLGKAVHQHRALPHPRQGRDAHMTAEMCIRDRYRSV